MHFLPVFELTSNSLTTIKVEQYQGPSNQSMLLIQEPIHEIFQKNFRELAVLKILLFLSREFRKILLHSHENKSKFIRYQTVILLVYPLIHFQKIFHPTRSTIFLSVYLILSVWIYPTPSIRDLRVCNLTKK